MFLLRGSENDLLFQRWAEHFQELFLRESTGVDSVGEYINVIRNMEEPDIDSSTEEYY